MWMLNTTRSFLFGVFCLIVIVGESALAHHLVPPCTPLCPEEPVPVPGDFELRLIHETAHQIRLEWEAPSEMSDVPLIIEKRYADGEWFTKARLDAEVRRYREIPSAHQVEDTPEPHEYAYRVVARPPKHEEEPDNNDHDKEEESEFISNIVTFTPTTLNVLINKTVESTSNRNSKTHFAPEAIDGNQLQDSRWHSRSTAQYESRGQKVPPAEWLKIDLGQVYSIDKCRIIWQRNYWGIDYQVEVSLDGEEWQTAYGVTGAEAGNYIHDFEFDAVEAHYVRFWGSTSTDVGLANEENEDRAGERSFSIMEFECFEPGHELEPGAFTSLATGSLTDASRNPITRAPEAVDGHMTSFWSTTGKQGRQWFSVDLDREVEVEQIKLFWHNRPDAYDLQIADQSQAWQTVGDESTLSSFTIGGQEVRQLQEAVFATPRTVQYIRVVTDHDAKPIQLPDVKPKPELLEKGFMLQELLVFEQPPPPLPPPEAPVATEEKP